VEFSLLTFTSRFTTLAFQFIERAFDDWVVGEERFYGFSDFRGKKIQGLTELGEFLFFFLALYAQYNISIQVLAKNTSKK